MSNTSLAKKQTIDLAIKKACIDANLDSEIKVGDMFFADRSDDTTIIKIREISTKYSKDLTVYYDHNLDYDCTKWGSYGSDDLVRFIERYGKLKLKESVSEYRQKAADILDGKTSIDVYKDTSFSENSTETALISLTNKENLKTIERELEKRKQEASLIKSALTYELNVRKQKMLEMKANLGLILADFEKKIQKVQKVIATIELYLGVNEDIVQIQEGNKADAKSPIVFRQQLMYMDEEVGDPFDGQGLDFNNIEDFDAWLLKYSSWYKKFNYQLLAPEDKCIVALRVSREQKHYSENPYVNAMLNEENKKTYFLIRNGECVYRIWGEITIEKLFPYRDELQKLKDTWDAIESKWDGESYSLEISKGKEIRDVEKEKDKIDNHIFNYKKQLILLQGLIDRTDILHPLSEPVQLLKEEAHEKGLVKFVYDDEKTISSGRKSFLQYLRDINSKIVEGSKILVVTNTTIKLRDEINSHSDGNYSSSKRENTGRFDNRFQSENSYKIPDNPNTGIYTVYLKPYDDVEKVYKTVKTKKEAEALSEKIRSEKEKDGKCHYTIGDMQEDSNFDWDTHKRTVLGYNVLVDRIPVVKYQEVIKYNPEDEVRNWWDRYDYGHSRKNRLSWEIYKNSDNFIINYDEVSIDDLEYYLFDRQHRRDYLTMIPVLKELYDRKIIEAKNEQMFIELLANQYTEDKESVIEKLQEAVQEFKERVKWKRSIADDDEKSWRIIKKIANKLLKSK